MIEKEGMRVASLQAEGRLHEAAMDRVPEHLIEHAKVQRGRVEGPVADERERAEKGRVEKDHREREAPFVPLEQRRYSHAQRQFRSEDIS